jgi:hypothetical protein
MSVRLVLTWLARLIRHRPLVFLIIYAPMLSQIIGRDLVYLCADLCIGDGYANPSCIHTPDHISSHCLHVEDTQHIYRTICAHIVSKCSLLVPHNNYDNFYPYKIHMCAQPLLLRRVLYTLPNCTIRSVPCSDCIRMFHIYNVNITSRHSYRNPTQQSPRRTYSFVSQAFLLPILTTLQLR